MEWMCSLRYYDVQVNVHDLSAVLVLLSVSHNRLYVAAI